MNKVLVFKSAAGAAAAQDLADLRAYADKLVKTNLFLTHEERELWKGLIPTMDEANLKDLIKAFEENKEDLKKALMANFKKDPEGKLIDKIKKYRKDSVKKMAKDVQENEAEKAEEALDSELDNL